MTIYSEKTCYLCGVEFETIKEYNEHKKLHDSQPTIFDYAEGTD